MAARGYLVVATLLLAGCLGEPITPSSDDGPRSPSLARPVVIAVIDSGVNPYLKLFQHLDGGFTPPGAAPQALAREGTYAERTAADADQWGAVEAGKLYQYTGTRLSAISFAREPTILDGQPHGAYTTYVAANEGRAAFVVAVQVDPFLCTRDPCLVSPTVAEAMEWVAQQPWIDIISVSLAIPAHLPDHPDLHAEMARYVDATRTAARAGKLLVSAAGNTPTPGLLDYFSGPPWIVTVGGMEPAARGEALVSSKGIDVAANFTADVPAFDSVDAEQRTLHLAGTSLAAPAVAGVLAQALAEARALRADVLAADARPALNASAVTLRSQEWAPRPATAGSAPYELSLPILAQPQMGWGYVNGSLAPEIARRVIEQDFTIPPEKDQAMVFQPAWQQAREEFWSRYSR